MFKSLQSRLSALFVAFVLLVLISVGATFWGLKIQQKDAVVINLAGRQRMLVQQMTRLALEESDGSGRSRDVLVSAEQAFEQTLFALENGGNAPYLSNNTVTLPAAQDVETRAALIQVRQSWGQYQATLKAIQKTPRSAGEYLSLSQLFDEQATQLVQQSDKVVRLYEAATTAKLNLLRNIQFGFLLCALFLLALGAWITRQSLLRPLTALSVEAARLGENQLETPVQVEGPDEMRKLAESFDGMRAGLYSTRRELLQLNNTLEKRVTQRTMELEALNEVSQEITSRLDIQQVLNSVTEKSRILIDGEVAFLCLLDSTKSWLKFQTYNGPTDALVEYETPVNNYDLANTVLASNKAVDCSISTCREGCSILFQKYRSSHLAAPLRINDTVIGALCVGSTNTQRFNEESKELLTKLANTAAIALENARLYQQAERIATLEERRRIAAEMHDGLGQTLSYLGLMTDQVMDFLSNGSEDAAMERLHRTRETIEKATSDVRKAINSLINDTPITLDLCDQLKELANEFSTDGGIEVHWTVENDSNCDEPPRVNEQIIHIAREALTNAIRHANASSVHITLKRDEGSHTLVIEDNGSGFDVTKPGPKGHFGLQIMKARALQITGNIKFFSTPGAGTQVVLSWPLETVK